MRIVAGMIHLAVAAICLSPLHALGAESANPTLASPAGDAYSDLNRSFVMTYSALATKNQKATRPILITSGHSYELYCEDGSVKVAPPNNPVENQLKAVSHLCAFLYAVSDTHWRAPDNVSWKTTLIEAQQKIEKALADIDQVAWTSDAWPGRQGKVKELARQSLSNARDFAATALKKGDITREDFRGFATKYTPAIQATFYLNSLSNAFDTLTLLKQWKQEMGDDAWSRMRVVIAAGGGRSTAGLTPETNPAAVVMATVMDPKNVKTNLTMAPAASTSDEALAELSLALTSHKLADAAFKDNEQAEWFYSALQHPDIPVALEPVRSALKDIQNGTVQDALSALGLKK